MILDANADNIPDWDIVASGISEELFTEYNTGTSEDPSDEHPSFLISDPLNSGYLRVVPSPTTTYPDFVYLDFQIPFTALQISGYDGNIDYNTAMSISMATSNSNNVSNAADFVGNTATVSAALSNSATLGADGFGFLYDTRDANPYSTDGTWSSGETVLLSGYGWPSSTSSFYNGGQLNVRIHDSSQTQMWSGNVAIDASGVASNAATWTIPGGTDGGTYHINVETPNEPGVWKEFDSFTIPTSASPPTITSTTIASNNATIDVTWSEAVFNTTGGSGALEASDFILSINGGSATLGSTTPSSISVSGNVYTLGLSLSGTPDGGETITVNPSSATAIYNASDVAASTTQTNNTVTLNDQVAPTMTLTASEVNDGDTSNDATLSLTFTSSESISNFTVDDISISNGSLSSFSGSGTTYSAIFTPTTDGAVTIEVAGSTFTDAAGNNNLATDQFNWAYDGTGPTMTITASEMNDGGTSNDATLSLTFTSSESTSDFVIGDIIVTNGALSSFSGSGTTYTATFTPTTDGAVTIDVDGSTFTDAPGNNNSAADQFNWTYDGTAPTVSTLHPADDATSVAINANLVITFNEVVDVESGDILIIQASDNNTIATIDVTSDQVTGSGTTTITIDPSTDLTAGIEYYVLIDASAFDDISGNSYAGISSTTAWSFTTSATSVPTITSTTVASNNATIDVTWSEAVFNTTGGSGALESSDFSLSISGGSATLSSTTPSSISVSVNVYTLGLSLSGTPDGGETITVVPSSDTAIYNTTDVAASTTQTNNTVSLNDQLAPTMTIAASEVNDGDTSNDGTLSLTFTSSESTSNFIVDDISLTNGALSSFSGSGTTYTATFTPTTDGAVTIDVAGSTFTDAAGNNNAVADQFNWIYDGTGPTMTITASEVNDGDTSNDPALSLTFTSSESTTNFEVGDIVVSNGTLSDFIGSGTTYTATFTFVAAGDNATTIDVAGSTFTDAVGNNNTAAEQFNWIYDGTAPTITTLSPEDDATGVAVNTNLIISFSETVVIGSGNITLKKSSDNSTIETIDITTGLVSGSNSSTITINPSNNLETETEYYILIDGTAFDDEHGNSFAGIASSTVWSFTTLDVSPPTFLSTTISNDNATISVTLSEAVFNATGGSGALESSDFALSLSGGTASLSSPTPISISIVGNVYTLGLALTGIPDGNETLTVVPSSATSIYDGSNNAASTTQTNNSVSLIAQTEPAIAVSKTVNDGEVQVETNVEYTITIENSGTAAGTLTRIQDTLPLGFVYVASSSTSLTTSDPTTSGQVLTWDGSWSVGIGETKTLTFTVTTSNSPGTYTNLASVEGSNFNPVNSGPTAAVTTQPRQISTTKTVSADTTTASTMINYTIIISNDGIGPVYTTTIADTLPTGFIYQLGSTTGLTNNDPIIVGPEHTWSGDWIINPGNTLGLSFVVETSPSEGLYYNHAGVVLDDNTTRAFTGPTAPVQLIPPPPGAPVISITKTANVDSIGSGDTLRYTISVLNTGLGNGSVTTIHDDLPSGFNYVAGSSTGLTEIDPVINNQELSWNGDWSIRKGESKKITLSFDATASLISGNYYNTAGVNGSDFNYVSTGPSAPVRVIAPALLLTKVVDSHQATPGDTLTYTVTYMNIGDDGSSEVIISETINPKTSFVMGSAEGALMEISYSHDGGVSYDNDDSHPVTHIKFLRNTILDPAGSGFVRFKVRVE